MITQDSIALSKHEVTSSGCEYEMNDKEIYWTNLYDMFQEHGSRFIVIVRQRVIPIYMDK